MGRPRNDSGLAIESRLQAALQAVEVKIDGLVLAMKQRDREIAELRGRLEQLEGTLGATNQRIDSVIREAADARTQRDLERRVGNLEQDVSRVQADVSNLGRR